MTQSDNSQDSLFRIMIATDNHLGYLEDDQIRGDDSFIAFEEILKISKSENIDFLLLGGDLFHHHNPSKKTIIRASNILQKHVYGQKDHKFDVYCYSPNFKNENLSIELPIFIIHGNHDDPSGFENFSSIDIFSNREVNYFGKINNHEQFDLYPILLIKGKTKIALYGIGNIKDERLYLALQNKRVNFHRPDDYKNWFNILIVHQNRFKGHHTGKNKKNYLPESFIPSFFDFVIWGHEHECFTEPNYNNEVGFHVYQPGSSVVTSLIQAESKQKHIGLLEVEKDRFRVVPVKLNTVRPFIYQQFELKSYSTRINSQEDIEKIIEEKIETLLEEAKIQHEGNPLIPIIRLKIEFSGYMIIRTNFILSKFSNKIANPNDVIQFFKKGDIFKVKVNPHNDCEMEYENISTNINIEDEMNENDELKKFINTTVSSFFSERNKKVMINSDIFTDFLEKHVNGNEKRSLELLFSNLYEFTVSNSKIDSVVLKTLQPLENVRKDFSNICDELVNLENVNNLLLNNEYTCKKKTTANRNSTGGINNYNKDIKLNKVNNFEEEKREIKKNDNTQVKKNILDYMSRSNSQMSSPRSQASLEFFNFGTKNNLQERKKDIMVLNEDENQYNINNRFKNNTNMNARKKKNNTIDEKIDKIDINKRRKNQFK
jgi:double-strand break repair protein MRE11